MIATPARSASGDYRPDLQGLRALAVTLVVLEHAGVAWLPGGFVGVDVFFVLSGYLITGLLAREHAATGRIAYGRFLARRLRRLGPGLALMLAVTTLAAGTVLGSAELARRTASLPYAAAWLSNFWFAVADQDYFAAGAGADLFLHTWSLGVEEQFYVLWPALLMAVLGRARSGPARLKVALGILAAGGFAAMWALAATAPVWAFYAMPARAWEFALGALAAVTRAPGVSGRAWAGWAGVALIVLGAVGVSRAMVWPGPATLAPVLGAWLVIAAGAPVLAHPAAVWLGDRAYALYLWHWPVLTLGGALGVGRGGAGDIVALVALSALLAMAAYRAVEVPLWKGRLAARRPLAVTRGAAAVLTVLIAGGGAFVALAARQPAPGDAAARRVAAVRFDSPLIYARECDTWHRSAALRPCLDGPARAPRTAVLVGDSALAQWHPAVTEVFAPPHWRVVTLTKSGCPMVDETYFYARIRAPYTVCTKWRQTALEHVTGLAPEVVIAGSQAGYPFTPAQWVDASRRVIAPLAAAARHVVVIAGTPPLGFDGPDCLARRLGLTPGSALWPAPDCTAEHTAPPTHAVGAWLRTAAQGLANVHVLDLDDLPCPGGRCAAQTADGRIVYRDDQHLTASFVRAQAPVVAARLRALGIESGAGGPAASASAGP